jgi:hypothetical protein
MLHSGFSNFEEATIATAVAWNIWKRRNNLVFNAEDEAHLSVTRRCLADVQLLASRCHNSDSAYVLLNWCITFDPPEPFSVLS